jgi:hypothetical protein
MIRLYFNKRGELPWSVDTGPGTKEYQTKQVAVLCSCLTKTRKLKPHEGPDEVPSAWLECGTNYSGIEGGKASATITQESDGTIVIR